VSSPALRTSTGVEEQSRNDEGRSLAALCTSTSSETARVGRPGSSRLCEDASVGNVCPSTLCESARVADVCPSTLCESARVAARCSSTSEQSARTNAALVSILSVALRSKGGVRGTRPRFVSSGDGDRKKKAVVPRKSARDRGISAGCPSTYARSARTEVLFPGVMCGVLDVEARNRKKERGVPEIVGRNA
jgi:hypothetical protein